MGTVFVNAIGYSLGSRRLGDELLGVSWSGGIGEGWGGVGAWCAAESRHGVGFGFGVSGRVDRGWMAGSS